MKNEQKPIAGLKEGVNDAVEQRMRDFDETGFGQYVSVLLLFGTLVCPILVATLWGYIMYKHDQSYLLIAVQVVLMMIGWVYVVTTSKLELYVNDAKKQMGYEVNIPKSIGHIWIPILTAIFMLCYFEIWNGLLWLVPAFWPTIRYLMLAFFEQRKLSKK